MFRWYFFLLINTLNTCKGPLYYHYCRGACCCSMHTIMTNFIFNPHCECLPSHTCCSTKFTFCITDDTELPNLVIGNTWIRYYLYQRKNLWACILLNATRCIRISWHLSNCWHIAFHIFATGAYEILVNHTKSINILNRMIVLENAPLVSSCWAELAADVC